MQARAAFGGKGGLTLHRLACFLLAYVLVAPLHGQTFTASLLGSREAGGGDGDAAGVALLVLEGNNLTFFLYADGLPQPTVAHIHQGRQGQTGDPVATLASSFSPVGSGWAAWGSFALDASVAAALRDAPTDFYVNLHTSEFPAGAVRGQLLAEASGVRHWISFLAGEKERPTVGDPDGAGVALLLPRGDKLVYYLRVRNLAAVTAAHIHGGRAGEAGPVVVDLAAAFSNGVAVGAVPLNASVANQLDTYPQGFYVNVHTAEFPAGAVRGQLEEPGEPLHLPVVADVPGLPPSLFRTAAAVANLTDREVEVWGEWYPASRDARFAPAKIVRFTVAPYGVASFANVVADLFGASGRGAVRLLPSGPIACGVNIFNDQRSTGGGTFGQFAQGLPLAQALSSGVLVYQAHRPKSSGSGWRTNLGWFNPNPRVVTVQTRVIKPDGSTLQAKTLTLQPWSDDLAAYDALLEVPGAQATQDSFAVAFEASEPVFFYSSVVDNRTDDGLYQPAQPAPRELAVPPAPGNHPPVVAITSPTPPVNAQVGQMIQFQATASDPDGDPLTVAWDFGDGVTDTTNSLVVSHAYANPGNFTVTVTASDGRGGSASATLQVSVATAAPTLTQLQNDIFTPRCSGCHPPSGGGLDLRAGHTYSSTVNVPSSENPSLMRVKPGDPDNSYLYRKLVGSGISGARMPAGGPFLTQSELDRVRGWILAGAPNN